MRDVDIRAALVDSLRRDFDGDKIVNEMGLCLGATRVDVAVINGSLHGYEIKSDRDTLARLPAQVELYSKVLDFSTIVCGSRYGAKIRDVVPNWWGIVEAHNVDGLVAMKPRRRARRNRICDPMSVAQLLWREEAAAVLRSRGELVRSRETRWNLWDRLAQWPIDELQLSVRSQLKVRPRWIND
ncbi:sce7726 family protein [Aldersonia kunmingensis]|uniref:sce7726 family protein n=1 Tax=Aldersonia kunmingensis TaxID=408066 RepID=UPI000834F034|nr:sce7726 family protein [Aldersonia kunmingensis]